jgi:glyoxylase-like metal-dependent hydrolase (beta-lactamase superfamily II)
MSGNEESASNFQPLILRPGDKMILEQISTGGDRNFGYFIAEKEEGPAAVIDPSGRPDLFSDLLERNKCRLRYVILTHSHYDHSGGAENLIRRNSALLVAHRHADCTVDMAVEDGAVLELGSLRLEIIHTPGHTEDSICVLCQGNLFTGDTLFVGKVGGTDLGHGASMEYESLHRKLMTLPEETRVYPGHDYGAASSSTIGLEKETNPFILCRSFEDFVELKANWAEYKIKHGIK